MNWLKSNIFDLLWAVIVVAILIYAMYTNNEGTIDKILLVALAIFKGVTIEVNKVDVLKKDVIK